MNELGDLLIEKRMEVKLSQKQLSLIAKVSNVQICNYESGKVTPSKDVLSRIATALKLPKDFFDEYLPEKIEIPSDESIRLELDGFIQVNPSDVDRIIVMKFLRNFKKPYERSHIRKSPVKV